MPYGRWHFCQTSLNAESRPAQPPRGPHVSGAPFTQALPRGKMDLSGGTTNGDLGQNHHEAERAASNGTANINRRGSQVFTSGRGDPTGASTNSNLGG